MKYKIERSRHLCLPALLLIVVFAVASILFINNAIGAEHVSVKVGSYENHPKIFVDENNKVAGFWPELLEYIAKKEQWKIEYIQGSWSEGLTRLEQKEIDIMPDVAFTEKRNQLYIFSKEPVLMSWSRLYVHKKNTAIHSIQDLNNTKIAALANSVNLEGSGGLRDILSGFNIPCTFIELGSYKEVFQAIDDGRVDGGITNRNFGNKNAKNYAVKNTPIIFQPINIKFAFPRSSSTTLLFAERINYHMAALIADENSLYYQLLKKYFEAGIAEKRVEVFPGWVKTIIQAISFLFIVLIIVIVTTRFQVQRKTRKIQEMNKALRLSEKKYRLLADKSPDLRYRLDMEGKIVYVSQAVHKLFGYTPEEAIGMAVTDAYVNQEDRERFLAALQQNGYVNNFAVQVKRKDGATWWAAITAQFYTDSDGNPIGIDGVTRDISEQREVELAIRRSDEQWDRTFNSFPDIVTLQDTDLRIIKANQAACTTLDLPIDAIVGHHCYELFHGSEDPCQDCPLLETRKTFAPYSREMVHQKLGKTFLVSAAPVLNEQGDLEYIAHVAKDITEMKLLEGQLLQSQKMEAIGTMAGGIAHDFNNILSAIIGYSEFIQDEVPKESKIGKDIAEVLVAGKRAADLVRQILTFSRQTASEKMAIKPHLIVGEALKMLHSTLPATVVIEEDIDPDCGQIVADPTIIHQIVVNLCTNSLQAMSEQKGILHVGLRRQELTAAETSDRENVSPGSFVVLTVTDSGAGMDQPTIDRIFEPYFTTRELGRGTGLGLAIVHGAVKEYHGFVEVDSRLGKGTVFSVYLPVSEEPLTREIALEQKVRGEALSGNARIMVVDDERLLVKINEKRLESRGYQVTAVTDSREALELFRNQPDSFDLLVTDQTMPGLTGAELVKAVLAIKPSLPVIMCTGHSDVVSKEEAIALGIRKYVLKPLHGDELLDAVGEVLAENQK
jgi:PAS domain S-box-containing protein